MDEKKEKEERFIETDFWKDFQTIDDALERHLDEQGDTPWKGKSGPPGGAQELAEIERGLERDLNIRGVKSGKDTGGRPAKPLEKKRDLRAPSPPLKGAPEAKSAVTFVSRDFYRFARVGIIALLVIIGLGGISWALYRILERNDPQNLYALANQLNADKQYQKAIVEYRAFLKEFPHHAQAADAQYFIGCCWNSLGEDDRAIESYRAVIENYPHNMKAGFAQYWLGKINLKQGSVNKAILEFQKQVRDYPDSGLSMEAYRDLADCYQRKGDFENAILAYQKAIASNEGLEDGYHYYQMGICYQRQGKMEKAEEMFDRVMASKTSEPGWIKKAEMEMEKVTSGGS